MNIREFYSLLLVIASLMLLVSSATAIGKRSNSDEESEGAEEIDDESDEELIMKDEVIDSSQSLLFDKPVSKDEAKRILSLALETINKGPTTSGSQSQRLKESEEMMKAKKLISSMTGQEVSSSSSGSQCEPITPMGSQAEEEYIFELATSNQRTKKVSMSTMKRILGMIDRKCSFKSIKAQYRWYERYHEKRFREFVASGGTFTSKLEAINEYVWDLFQKARDDNKVVHESDLRRWAWAKACDLNIQTQFKATTFWVHAFKKNHGIVSRKITKVLSRTQREKADQYKRSIEYFHSNYYSETSEFPIYTIMNTDQVPFSYELASERTLSIAGERDTFQSIDSKGKTTHSYTTQPIITRDGKLLGKLLICLQEPKSAFGPRVEAKVRELEYKYKNVYVVASESGKMTKHLVIEWARNVLLPALGQTEIVSDYNEQDLADSSPSQMTFPNTDCWRDLIRAADSECFPQPNSLLLMDAWSGQQGQQVSSYLRFNRVKVLPIPPGVTAHLQPLDVIFNRQYKKLAKRISREADMQGRKSSVTSREGIINFQSFVFNQLSAPAYQDLLLYSWHKTDPSFDSRELSIGDKPDMVDQVQFSFEQLRNSKCQVEGCSHEGFITCSYCGKILCFDHFLERHCFHDPGHDFIMHIDHQTPHQSQNTSVTTAPPDSLVARLTTSRPMWDPYDHKHDELRRKKST